MKHDKNLITTIRMFDRKIYLALIFLRKRNILWKRNYTWIPFAWNILKQTNQLKQSMTELHPTESRSSVGSALDLKLLQIAGLDNHSFRQESRRSERYLTAIPCLRVNKHCFKQRQMQTERKDKMRYRGQRLKSLRDRERHRKNTLIWVMNIRSYEHFSKNILHDKTQR